MSPPERGSESQAHTVRADSEVEEAGGQTGSPAHVRGNRTTAEPGFLPLEAALATTKRTWPYAACE